MRHSFHSEQLSGEWRYLEGLLGGTNVDRVLSSHDDFGCGDEFEEVRIGGLLRLDEQLEQNSPVEQHRYFCQLLVINIKLRSPCICSQLSSSLIQTILIRRVSEHQTRIHIYNIGMERSRFAETQTLVIQEARELRGKLLEMKKKKEQQNNQLMKAELSELYNSKFEQFKKKLDEQEEDQLTSLELAKELRLTEIIDVQNRIKDYISNIEQQEKTLKQKSAELSNAYQDALAFLGEQMQHEYDAIRRQKEEQLAEKVLIYKDSIDIE